MKKEKLRKLLLRIFGCVLAYVLVGALLDQVLFPEPEPDVSCYPKEGQSFVSKTEGFRQTIVKREQSAAESLVSNVAFQPKVRYMACWSSSCRTTGRVFFNRSDGQVAGLPKSLSKVLSVALIRFIVQCVSANFA